MGDPKQTDLQGKVGIGTFLNLVTMYDPSGVHVIEFGLEDIVRSSACAQMVKMFYKAGL
jgi:phosphate starvation-inducible protein PhoH